MTQVINPKEMQAILAMLTGEYTWTEDPATRSMSVMGLGPQNEQLLDSPESLDTQPSYTPPASPSTTTEPFSPWGSTSEEVDLTRSLMSR